MRSIAVILIGVCVAGCSAGADGNAQGESAIESASAGLQCVDVGRYEVKGSLVVDTASGGRLWQRNVDPLKRAQPDAEAYCAELNVDGRTGWRLPTVNELSSIRYKPGLIEGGPTSCAPSIDQVAFPDTPPSQFWTSTVRPLGDAYYTGFSDGRSHSFDRSEPMYARCMHDSAPSSVPRIAD